MSAIACSTNKCHKICPFPTVELTATGRIYRGVPYVALSGAVSNVLAQAVEDSLNIIGFKWYQNERNSMLYEQMS